MTDSQARHAFVKSFGCQMNVYDSQRIADLVKTEGFGQAARIEDADLIVLNTCHIRERASEKIYSELGKIRELKEERAKSGRETTVVVAGCVAQAQGSEIVRRQPAVDIVVGTQSYHRLPTLLRNIKSKSGLIDTAFPIEDKFKHLPAPGLDSVRARGVTAFVTVQEGCDKFCSFCVVPYTRGAEQSRSAASVIDEVSHLARSGVREVTLIGQNVNAYHGVDENGGIVDLPELLTRTRKIHGILRIRYTTSHPRDMTEALICSHRDNETLAPYLHLPVQSGSDRILQSMNRGHSIANYIETIRRVRTMRPDIALSSDFIVGFPGETDADFDATMDLVREVKFAASYAFKYSARPGTPGANMDFLVDEPTKAARLLALQNLLEDQRQSFNRALVGKTLLVLFEKPGRQEGQFIGRSCYMQSVYATGEADMIGNLVEVEIIGVGPNSLQGRVR